MLDRLIFFLLMATFCGCAFFTQKVVYQTKKPKTEDSNTIAKWLFRNKINADNIITVSPESYYTTGFFFSSGPMVYSIEGVFISIGYSKGLKFCPNGVYKEYSLIDKEREREGRYKNFLIYWNADEKKVDTICPTINSLIRFARDLHGNQLSHSFFSESQYKIIIAFSIFWGSHAQVKSIKEFIEAARNNTHKVQIVLLNFDKQFWWGEEWLKRINIEA
jgi:hypothetical protein